MIDALCLCIARVATFHRFEVCLKFLFDILYFLLFLKYSLRIDVCSPRHQEILLQESDSSYML